MGDHLENFILENRSAFDSNEPSDEVWNKLNSRLKKRPDSWTMIWKIAAVLFLVSTVYLIVERQSNDQGEMPSYVAEFNQAEQFYTSLIMEKKSEISLYEFDELEDDFIKDIDQLDKMYEELKNTFNSELSDQKLIDAMITNLQLRIDILNQQLMILERLNNQNNESKTIQI